MSLLVASGLGVARGGRTVLGAVALSVAPGEVVGLLGPNGAGKTSLLRTLARLEPPAGGQIALEGRPLESFGRGELARLVAFLPQPSEAAWPITVENLVSLGRLPFRSPFGRATEADAKAVEDAIVACDLDRLRARPVTTLSAGEASRAFLARALAGQPRLLLADEPTANLDPAHQITAMTVLRGVAERGGSVVMAQHDLPLAARFCDRLLLLGRGRLVAQGRPAEVLTPDNLAAVFGVRGRYPDDGGDEFFVIPWSLVSGHAPDNIGSP
ncbi:MAG TPA: ABC transporter ATP-binding protein [Alphaproteobacteria bacterium]|nr:ABC transporter ATP-binding protein [Alphaproteobacteria bacterium]